MISKGLQSLPDHVFCSIISLLPLREAIAVGVLSRQWRNHWHYLSRLDLDPGKIMGIKSKKYDIKKAFQDSIPIINHVLECQKGKILNSCRIMCISIPQFSECFIKWIVYLKESKQIQKLTLYYRRIGHDDEFSFPDSFFQCKTLHLLELEKFKIKDASPFKGCVNITTLRLKSIITNNETLNRIISNCNSLENLIIISCSGLENLEIRNTTLKHLEIKSLCITRFILRTKGLVVLSIYNLLCFSSPSGSGDVVIECPNIKVLKTHSSSDSVDEYFIRNKIIDQCVGLLKLYGNDNHFSPELTERPYGNLRELYISFDLDDIKLKVLLRFIFSANRNLYKLEIKNQSTPLSAVNPWKPKHISWDQMELSDCVSRHLRIVRIKGFTGKELQIQFATFLIKNAAKMDELEIVIQWGYKCSDEEVNAIKGLLLVPRASLDARIKIKTLDGMVGLDSSN